MMIVNTTLVIVVVGLSMLIVQAYAWLLPSITRGDTKRSFLLRITDSTENDWSATDNWNRLSKDNQEINTNHLLIADQITLAALRMQNFGMNPAAPELSKEDQWLRHVIEHIVTDDEEEVDTKPSSVDKHTTRTETFSDDMGREIALLVRCNQNPHDLLMEGGRMVEELTDQQRNDVRQLVQYDGTSGAWQATPFLREAASSMFQTHVSNNKPDRQGINGDSRTLAATKSALDAVSVASWMSKSLRETVGPHDKRVTQAVARFGSGGYLVEADLLNLYVTSITGEQPQWSTITQLEHHRTPEIMAVWRDIRNHGLVTPAEFEQSIKVAELQAKYGVLGVEDTYSPMNMLDECEILEDHMVSDVSMTTDRHGKSSHERVDLVRGIPIWMKDGDFGTFMDDRFTIGVQFMLF